VGERGGAAFKLLSPAGLTERSSQLILIVEDNEKNRKLERGVAILSHGGPGHDLLQRHVVLH
jgi:hypothetical protein